MMRSFIIYLSKASWAKKIVTSWGVARRVVDRFVAGDNLPRAVAAVKELNAKGINATLDQLGENTTDLEDARRAKEGILEIISTIVSSGIRSNVSLKLSQLGMTIAEDSCADNLAEILAAAKQEGIFVRIDMEDAPWVDPTIRIYREMRLRGFDNVGMVIQSYLYRSEEDIRALSVFPTKVRLCKGAYKEPAEIAFPKKSDVDANYDKLVDMLIDCALSAGSPAAAADGRVPPIPGIATHDPLRIEHACAYAEKAGLPKNAIEFQMLYGIRRDLQEDLVQKGYPVRVYVPFGTQWYPYFMRRLAERPANIWFFISNFFKH